MEDVCHGCVHPNVADIKLGTRTYDPLASPEKVAKEQSKYQYQAQLGMRLTGMQIYRAMVGTYERFDRFYGRSLTPDLVGGAVAALFGADTAPVPQETLALLRGAMAQVADLLAWFKSQHTVRLFSSSVLLVLDAGVSSVRVRLIDFAHAYAAAQLPDADDGCIVGLTTLTGILDDLVKKTTIGAP